MRVKIAFITAGAALLQTVPAAAHHSHGNYQMTEYTHLNGTVTQVYWANPHTWLYLDVVGADGQVEAWALEAAAAVTLTRAGIPEDMVRIGDSVSVRCHQLRDGSNGCLLGFLTPEGGIEKEWD